MFKISFVTCVYVIVDRHYLQKRLNEENATNVGENPGTKVQANFSRVI